MMTHAQMVSELRLSWLRRAGWFMLLHRLLRLRARRKALDHLRNLPDYLLKDIGLSRLDVVFPEGGVFGQEGADDRDR
jgi:uncharacterized protein YjiS (DUF1127 family)